MSAVSYNRVVNAAETDSSVDEESSGEFQQEMKFQTLNVSDWRQAIRNPPSYRIGNSTVRLQTKFIYLVIAVGAAILLYFYAFGSKPNPMTNLLSNNDLDTEHGHIAHVIKDIGRYHYNSTYPLSPPITSPKGIIYKIYVISDLDTASKSKTEDDTWVSYLKRGLITYNPSRGENSVSVEWLTEVSTLKSGLASGGRGMELSELIVFNGKMFTMDDRTGIVYELNVSDSTGQHVRLVPWVILPDGNGKESKGFKSEWAAVKDQQLYVGGLGKEWTSAKGELIHLNPQWIKIISPTGEVEHVDWHANYEKIKAKVNIKSPGYMIHEAVAWSSKHNKWIFLPRRASKERYDENEDERRGTNLLIMASEDFADITAIDIGDVVPTHGFSSFKFMPNAEDEIIVALKSEEDKGTIASYIMAFNIQGKILLPETKIGDYKFEGIEFG